jgi:uncharacterized protein YihD (DUF1040 family)
MTNDQNPNQNPSSVAQSALSEMQPIKGTRDPERIDKILSELRTAWVNNPDVRFFQLLSAVRPEMNNEDQFYKEDNLILDDLCKFNLKNRGKSMMHVESNVVHDQCPGCGHHYGRLMSSMPNNHGYCHWCRDEGVVDAASAAASEKKWNSLHYPRSEKDESEQDIDF